MSRVERTDWQERGNAPMSRKQQNLLNAACGDLALCIPRWHGIRFTKDDYRHLIAAVALGRSRGTALASDLAAGTVSG